ncbi:MAG: TRAP transporter large permease [Lawsonibacter sp.]|jgi:tripartite ATP-independent transporter DctM subunit
MSFALVLVLVILFAMLIIGAPVVFAIGTAAASYFLVKPGMLAELIVYPHKFFTGMDSFVFLCIPLFTLSGELMSQTGMMSKMVKFCQLFVGRLRGGLAYVNVLASMMFGGVSGSGLADVAALGPIEVQMMKEDGYDADFAAALTASSAIQGPIIPPSIPMVIYASLTNASVGALFLGGLVPGIMVGCAQMLIISLMAKKRNFPKRDFKISHREKLSVIWTASSALLMPLIIIGGIISGIFTATEASAVAVFYALIVGLFFYRNITPASLFDALKKTARTSASIYLIIAFTGIISWILAMEGVPSMLSSLVSNYHLSPYALLLFVNLFFLFNGMWISDTAQLILFAPIFAPIFSQMGVSTIHFGVVMVVNVMISLITPPYGTALYLAAGITGSPLRNIVKEVFPFLCSSIVVLFLITYFPVFVLTVPRLFGLL